MKPKYYNWIKQKRVIIPLVIFLVYHAIFNSFTGQLILDRAFAAGTENARLESRVSYFSLFFGLVVHDLSVHCTKEFTEKPIFTTERLALRYNLPALLLGRVSITEIGLRRTQIHILEDSGRWNFLSILPASTDGSPKPDEEIQSNEEDSKEYIALPIPMSFFAHLDLDSVDIFYEIRSQGVTGSLRGWKTELLLDSRRSSRIPLSLAILDWLDRIRWEMNPDSMVAIQYKDSRIEVSDSLNLSFLVIKQGNENNFELKSLANLGGENLTITRKNGKQFIFNANLNFDMIYQPGEDTIYLPVLSLRFRDDIWLQGSGRIERPFSTERVMEFNLAESKIQLAKVDDLLKQLPMDPMRLDGVLELSPLVVKGATKNLELEWQAKARDFYFTKGNTKIASRFLDLDISSTLDLDTTVAPTASNPLPLLKSLDVRKLRVAYNGLYANLRGKILPTERIDLDLNLDRLQVNEFTKSIYGSLDTQVRVTGSNFSELDVDGDIKLSAFRFFMDRSRSGNSHNALNTSLKLFFNKPFGLEKVELKKFNLLTKNASGATAVKLGAQGNINLEEGNRIELPALDLEINFTQLLPILPLPLRESILPIESNITKNLRLGLVTVLDLRNRIYDIKLAGKLPGLNLNDLAGNLTLKLSQPQEPSYVDLTKFSLRGFSNSLGIDVKGRLFEKPGAPNPPLGPYFGNLDMEIFLKSNEERDLSSQVNYRGNINLKAKVRDNILEGMLVGENVRLFISRGECPGNGCKIFLVENLNADIPVHHDLSKEKSPSLIDADKSRFIKTYGRIPRDNLSVFRVLGTHPSIPGAPFAYVTSNGHRPGLTGRVQYRENYLFIDGLKLTLLDGMVYGKDILLNVGQGKPKEMEFMGSIQVRDIDLKQMLSRQVQATIDDGKIKADLNLSGRDLSDPIPGLNLYFSIYQIGRNFGKSVLNVISNKGALMNYITDSYAVDKVEVELSKGLVYADVLFKRSLLSYMVSLEDSKISQQRMPLANFLKRAESEIASYR